MNDYSEFVDIFLDEAIDALSDWEKTCLNLSKQYSVEGLNSLFRIAHNMKGSSKSVQLSRLGDFIHSVENLIQDLRSNNLEFEAVHTEYFLSAHEVLSEWIENLRADRNYFPETSIDRFTNKFKEKIKGQGERISDTKKLGQILVEEGFASKEVVAKAIQIQSRKLGEVLIEEGLVQEDKVTRALEIQHKSNPNSKSDSLRVKSSKVDDILQYVGELSTQLNIVWEASRKGQLETEVTKSAIQLCHKTIKDLQDRTLELRMQPLQLLFQRLERTAVDISSKLEKKLEVHLEGNYVELDKSVIENIVDPFVHIVRNAIDHGIESPNERLKADKTEVGSISITAVQNPGNVEIIVKDDGRGLNIEKITSKALKLGLIDPSKKYTNKQIFNLICHPGFSTSESITEISGRGVGMDVVSSVLSEFGGQLEINSIFGFGSEFKVTLPTSLSIVEALIIEVDSCKYAVPIQDISEVIDVSHANLSRSTNGKEYIDIRGKVVPVKDLNYVLAKTRPSKVQKKDHRPALIFQNSMDTLAYSVDKIIGQQQVVIRKLAGEFANVHAVSGSTILGDGEPGFILSLVAIARDSAVNDRIGA